MDDEEEKKAAAKPKPKPIKKMNTEDGGFLAQLEARLA